MRKVLFIALAAFALFSCNKEIAIVEDEAQSQPLKYIFNVADRPSFDADTRAGKDSWVEGDKIYIIFDDVLPTKYEDFTILEYKTVDSDLEWVITEGSNKPLNTGGKLDALYYENNNPTVLYERHIFYDYESPLAGQYVYLVDNNVDYKVKDNIVEFSLSMDFQADITYVQFRVTGLDREWNFSLKDSQHNNNSFEMPIPVWNANGAFASSGIVYGDKIGDNVITGVPMGIRTDGHYEYLIVNQKAEAITITLENATTGDSYYKTFNKKITGKSAAITFKGPQIEGGVITNGWTKVTDDINGHEYVDMGTGVKWATMNLGASKPEEYGDYFAWGETEPYYTSLSPLAWKEGKSSGYDWASYSYGSSQNSLTKYNSEDNKTSLEDTDDAATKNWGSPWRMPSDSDWWNLMRTKGKEDYTWTWCDGSTVKYNDTDVSGWKIMRNSTSATLFLPAAGYWEGTSLKKAGEGLSYLSSAVFSNTNGTHWLYAFGVYFDSEEPNGSSWWRYNGIPIRPVCD